MLPNLGKCQTDDEFGIEKLTFGQVGVKWLVCKYHLGLRNAVHSNASWGPQKGGNYSASADCV
jgi:hypothetical protein